MRKMEAAAATNCRSNERRVKTEKWETRENGRGEKAETTRVASGFPFAEKMPPLVHGTVSLEDEKEFSVKKNHLDILSPIFYF